METGHMIFLFVCFLTPILIIVLLRKLRLTGPKVEKGLKENLNDDNYRKRKNKIQIVFGIFLIFLLFIFYEGYETSRGSDIDEIISKMEHIYNSSSGGSTSTIIMELEQLGKQLDKVYIEGIEPSKNQRKRIVEIQRKFKDRLGSSLNNLF